MRHQCGFLLANFKERGGVQESIVPSQEETQRNKYDETPKRKTKSTTFPTNVYVGGTRQARTRAPAEWHQLGLAAGAGLWWRELDRQGG